MPPFPAGADPEEYDRLRRRVLWKMPSGLYVIGVRSGERHNAMTLNWASQMGFDPKLLAVGVQKDAYTHELLADAGVFALNLVHRDDRAIVRRFTKPVDVDLGARTLNGFPFHDAPVTGAPVLDRAVAWLDCEVRRAVDLGGHTLFLGEIVDCGFQAGEDEPVLRMEDTRMNYGG